jgi:hypothetical protein
MAAGKRAMLSAMSATRRATVVSIKARKIELALVNPVGYDLGRTRCTPSREIVRFATDQRTTKAPMIPREDIGPRSETMVAHDLAAGPTPPARKTNGWNTPTFDHKHVI